MTSCGHVICSDPKHNSTFISLCDSWDKDAKNRKDSGEWQRAGGRRRGRKEGSIMSGIMLRDKKGIEG